MGAMPPGGVPSWMEHPITLEKHLEKLRRQANFWSSLFLLVLFVWIAWMILA